MKHIISFSGGKDSSAMLLMMIEKNMPIDEIIFCDTGKEFPAMYKHIDKIQKFIGRKITTIRSEKSFEYLIGTETRQNQKGKNVGFGWMDFRFRWCTGELKRDITRKYLKNIGEYVLYIGFAFNEQQRAVKNKNQRKHKYPLIDWQITERQALEYCYSKGFRWNGLYEKFSRVSCYCCPLKSLSELYILYNEFPKLWADIKKMNKKSYRQFRPDYSVEDLERKFEGKKKQKLLWG